MSRPTLYLVATHSFVRVCTRRARCGLITEPITLECQLQRSRKYTTATTTATPSPTSLSRMTSALGSASDDVLAKLYATCRLPSAAGSIRCLKIFKGAGDGRLRCQLDAYASALEHRGPAYYAISYTWGDRNVKKPVYINGLRVWISANAHAALMDCRSEAEDRLVWIDAICINQDDEAEKNTQVAMMRRIYSQALGTAFLDPAAVLEASRPWLA